jgi:hypothetical protein
MAKGDAKKVQIRNAGQEGDPHYVIHFRGRDLTQFCREWELITGFVVPAQHVVDAVINVAAQSEWKALPAKKKEKSLPMPLSIREHLAGGNVAFEPHNFHWAPPFSNGSFRDRETFHDYERLQRERLEQRLIEEAQARFRHPHDQATWIERERRSFAIDPRYRP